MREIARATLLFLSPLIRETVRVVIPVSSARYRFARGGGGGEKKARDGGGFRSKVASRTIGRVKMNPRDLYIRERNSQGAINLRAEVGTSHCVTPRGKPWLYCRPRDNTPTPFPFYGARCRSLRLCRVFFSLHFLQTNAFFHRNKMASVITGFSERRDARVGICLFYFLITQYF